jgi:hypothetical protein
MAYIKLSNQQYPISEADIRDENPDTSFAHPFVPPADYAVVFIAPQPAYDAMREFVREIAPKLSSKGQWEQQFEVVALEQEQIDANEQAKAKANATQAKALLLDSDWSDLPSVRDTTATPHLTNTQEWDTYRLALRVIAIGELVNPTWPLKPNAAWS